MSITSLVRLIPVALAALCLSTQAEAGPVLLTQSDVALAIYQQSVNDTSPRPLDSTSLAGFFGVHRCLCPDPLWVQLQLTSSGQTNLGSSTIGVSFLLGQSCLASPSGCTSLGQASFSSTQSAPSPTFSSNLVFQAVEGVATVNCQSLSAGTTTVWAILTQDGSPLSFAPTIDLPVVTGTVGAPTAVTAEPADQGILVSWTPPSDATLVAGYQVLCLPRPAAAQTAGYESCGLASSGAATTLSPADVTQVCSRKLPASATSVRLSGLANGTTYTLGVIAIDASGGTSPLSPPAVATPQPTMGFWQKYKQDGGAASGCSISPWPARGRPAWLAIVLGFAMSFPFMRRGHRRKLAAVAWALLAAAAATASAQDEPHKESDQWAMANPPASRPVAAPDWALEVGVSWYRPAIDDEPTNGYHPFADTFSGSRHPLWEVEVDRYLSHRAGTWGVGLRSGYYRVTASAFLSDGTTRSGDETALRLIPFSPSLLYRANGLPGQTVVPLIPYAKLGLDAMYWAVTTSGSAGSQSGVSWGWHAALGAMLGLPWLASGPANAEGLADPCALFFEWDYSAINGLGLTNNLHVGDSIWFAGLMFDL